jgi:fatty acid desaturase
VFAANASGLPANLVLIVSITLWVTGLLCLLNVALAIVFRKRKWREVVSYYTACIIELLVFVLALLFMIGVIKSAPFHLPPDLPFNQGEIAAALAIGIGLFPAAYWHRVNLSDLPERIAEDGRTMKEHRAGVSVHNSLPGEWMN